ncbi:hypothetical protein SLS55_005844 [Diplodia seriata]|uniref:RING-type domain-containing protein n=1 Tax=Diplodia seriata TaxID=420778 RepID=A0ABR3CHI6_9PEZI
MEPVMATSLPPPAAHSSCPVHCYEHRTFFVLASRQDLERRNDDTCAICRGRYDLDEIDKAFGKSVLDRHCMMSKIMMPVPINSNINPLSVPAVGAATVCAATVSATSNTQGKCPGSVPTRRARFMSLLRRLLGLQKKNSTNTDNSTNKEETVYSFEQLKKLYAESEPMCPGLPLMLACGHIFGAKCFFQDSDENQVIRRDLCPYCQQTIKFNREIFPGYRALYKVAIRHMLISEKRFFILAVPFTAVLVEALIMATSLDQPISHLSETVGSYDSPEVLAYKARRQITGHTPDKPRDFVHPEVAFRRLAKAYSHKKLQGTCLNEQRRYESFIKVVIGRVIDEQLWERGMTYRTLPSYYS